MKKFLFILLTFVLVVSMYVPMVIPSAAATTITIVSDTSTRVIGVYNKASGSNFVPTLSPVKYAVLAEEPVSYPFTYSPQVSNSVWDQFGGLLEPDYLYFQTNYPDADWIWETPRAEGPAGYGSGLLYDSDASINGRVVVFQDNFTITGKPQYATLHIAADNCYEVWINGNHVKRSDTAKVADWANSDLRETSVASQGWQKVGHYSDLGSYLHNGENTIEIIAGNENYNALDDNNNDYPPYRTSPEYSEYRQYNPGGLIFALDIQSVDPPVPEMPAGALLGLGLVFVGGIGWLGYRKSRSVTV
jgi:hypothetical protein